jgi:hypothetical protein
MPIPPSKNIVAVMVSRLNGKRYTSLLRFHSSLALRFSVGDNGVPKRCAEAVSPIIPAMANTKPTSWIRKMLAISLILPVLVNCARQIPPERCGRKPPVWGYKERKFNHHYPGKQNKSNKRSAQDSVYFTSLRGS